MPSRTDLAGTTNVPFRHRTSPVHSKQRNCDVPMVSGNVGVLAKVPKIAKVTRAVRAAESRRTSVVMDITVLVRKTS